VATTYPIRSDLTPGGSDSAEDVILCRRFLAGDDAAFVELYRRYHRRLRLYCLKMVGEPGVAEDLAQEMWERVIEMRRDTTEVRSPLALFHRIARNLCLDHLKLRKHHLPIDELTDSALARMGPREPSAMEDMVSDALEQLPFETRDILVLNLYCGFRFDEIATMLGKSADAVWARASRGRAQLRRIVADALADERRSKHGDRNGGTNRGSLNDA
jgi:RNA polymerase sigma-70 factor (ECF subfamily)